MKHVVVAVLGLLLGWKLGMFRSRTLPLFYLWCLWSVLASYTAGPAMAIRWPVAIAFALAGVLLALRRNDVMLSADVLCAGLLSLVALASTLYSPIPNYTLLRAGGMALLLVAAVAGARALAVPPDRFTYMYRALQTALLLSLVYLFTGAQDHGLSVSVHSRWTLSELKATGTATAALSSLIFLAPLHARARGLRVPLLLGFQSAVALILLATRTRGALLIALVVLPFLHITLRGHRRLYSVLAGYLALLCIGAATLPLLGEREDIRTFLRIGSEQEILRTRFDDKWEIAWPKARERPLLGRGFGTSNFYTIDDDILRMQSPDAASVAALTHNDFLSTFYDLGLLGFLPFLGLLACHARALMRSIGLPPGPLRDMQLTLGAFWLQLALGMMFHNGRLTIGNPAAYWMWIAGSMLVIGHGVHVRQTARPVRRPSPAATPRAQWRQSGVARNA